MEAVHSQLPEIINMPSQSDDYVRFRSGCNITVVSAKKDGIHTNESVITAAEY